MKKFMFVVITLSTFLVSFTKLNASVKLETEETAVGSIKMKLVFEQGYVGAVDTFINVQGNVSVDNLIWDNSLSSYVKRYSYDANNKSLRIIISTGDSSKNLLDKYGVLNIGELKLSNKTSESQSYSFSTREVDMVNADYKTNAKLDVNDEGLKEYIIKIDNPVTPKPDEPTIPDNNEGNNNDNNNSGDNTGNNDYVPSRPSGDNTVNDNQVSDDENQENPSDNPEEDKNEEEINNPIIDKDKNSNNKNEDSKESKDVETHNQRIVRYLWMILGGLIVIAIILAGIYAKKQNKLNKMQ